MGWGDLGQVVIEKVEITLQVQETKSAFREWGDWT